MSADRPTSSPAESGVPLARDMPTLPPGPLPAVALRGVSKVYGSGRAAVAAIDRIDLDVAPGELVCIVGASGCGKSTLLNLVAGLDQPTAGRLDVEGRTALMFQDAALFPWLTVAGNIDLALKLRAIPKQQRVERIDALLRTVHLDGFAAKRPHELSGGMRQRVALARAFAQDADVLLMDEPFGALDAMTRDILHDELEGLWRDRSLTIVFVTHNVREAARLADRIVVLSSRPGCVTATFDVAIDRPRRIESAPVSELAATVTETLRQEVRRHATDRGAVDHDLAGLDALELAARAETPRHQRLWRATWPKVAALGLGLVLWQAVVWLEWKPDYVLPGPGAVFADLWDLLADGTIAEATAITLRRAATGFTLAVVIGTAIGSLVARIRPLRAAVGSLITGVQTMPSIAWFPLAILIFKISEQAILFVVVFGAAPAIANGLISGTDHIPPILLRAGHVLGARGLAAYRHIILPASLPAFVGGLKQGWAFAWRSLMAGELIVIVAGKPSVGSLLQNYRNLNNAEGLMAMMIVILVIGIAVDTLLFGTLDRAIRHRWGLLDPIAA